MSVKIIMREDGVPEIIDERFRPRTPEEQAEKTKIIRQCGHVKRRLCKDQPLTGKTLEFALSIVGEGEGSSDEEKFWNEIARKLKAGQTLNEYEYHMLVEVRLLHVRLAS